MIGYQRFVAYIYEYRKGKKGENCGFLKVELKNGNCEIELHLKCPGLTPGRECRIYGFVRKLGELQGILLGVCTTASNQAECVLEMDGNNLHGSGVSLKELGGMVLLIEGGGFYGTQWDEESIRPEDFVEMRPEAGVVSERPEKPVDSASDPSSGEENLEKENPKEENLEEKNPEEEKLGKEKLGEENLEEKKPEKENLEEKNQGEENLEEKKPREKKLGERNPEKGNLHEEKPKKENLEEKNLVEENPEEKNSGEKNPGERNPEVENLHEKNQEKENLAEPAYQEEPKTDQIPNVIPESQTEEKKPELHSTAAEDEKILVSPAPSAAAKAPSMEELNTAGDFDPFGDGEILQCRRMERRDFSYLNRRDWALRNNRFLLYGFYHFGHLLLGRLKDGQYILGVPGIYDQQERFMANMFGFPHFKYSPQVEIPQGKGGYWYRLIYPPNFR